MPSGETIDSVPSGSSESSRPATTTFLPKPQKGTDKHPSSSDKPSSFAKSKTKEKSGKQAKKGSIKSGVTTPPPVKAMATKTQKSNSKGHAGDN